MPEQHPSGREVRFLTVHGHTRAFVMAGQGPPVLLLHGLGCDHTTWEPVIDRLAEHFTVIAPDLLGHGLSASPRADYSLGGYANGMRDLLTVLGIERVTVVGHSLGGGVAMQFAYQFPERTQRLMLVSSGGLGPEVSPVIRAITTPGYQQLLGALTVPVVRHLGVAGLKTLAATGWKPVRDLGEVAAIYDTFKDPERRAAIRHVVRAVVDWRGQVVTMADRAYLTDAMPMAVVWGRDDMVIPVKHASNAATLAPKAQVEVYDDAGHFPHRDHPDRFVESVERFVRTTKPAVHSRAKWRRLLTDGKAGGAPLTPVPDAGTA